MKVVLETPRLALREMVPGDLDFVAGMLAHPEVMRYYPRPLDRDEARAWLERQLARYAEFGHGLWLAVQRGGGAPVGQVGLIVQEVDGQREREIGYLIDRPFWRQGLATEAALAVRSFAFDGLGLDRVISLIRPANEPSQGVARKLGMTPRRQTLFRGRPTLVFEVRRDELAAC
jgi:RimJ/RimL family protein N-acetyltransferase